MRSKSEWSTAELQTFVDDGLHHRRLLYPASRGDDGECRTNVGSPVIPVGERKPGPSPGVAGSRTPGKHAWSFICDARFAESSPNRWLSGSI